MKRALCAAVMCGLAIIGAHHAAPARSNAVHTSNITAVKLMPIMVMDDTALSAVSTVAYSQLPAHRLIAAATPEYDAPVEVTDTLSDVTALDTETKDALRLACNETGVDVALAIAIIWRETNFQNVIGDNGNSYGYMQVQPRWHAARMEKLGVDDLMDPLSNFRVGCDLLAELLSKYTLEEALTAYNSGSPGSSAYADNVLAYMAEH